MAFLASLDDESKWVKQENVPICRPLVRVVAKRQPDGSILEKTVEITAADLPTIAEEINRMERETGTLPLATIGHRSQEPNFPEHLQPPAPGVFRGAKVGTFGPGNMPCVLSTQYIRREKWAAGFGLNGDEGAKDFPHRSMDIYPEQAGMLRKWTITGVALLKKDPFLQMGILSFELDPRMADEPKNDEPNGEPPAAPTAAPAAQPLTMAMLEAHPIWQFMCKMAMSSGVNPAAPAAPAAGAPPAPPAAMNQPTIPVQFQVEFDAMKAALKLQGDALAKQESEALVFQLCTAGVKDLHGQNAAAERTALTAELAAIPTSAARQARATEILKRWDKDPAIAFAAAGAPVGPMLPLALNQQVGPDGAKPDPRKAFTRDHEKKANEYMRHHEGCSWEEAEQYALGERTLLGDPITK